MQAYSNKRYFVPFRRARLSCFHGKTFKINKLKIPFSFFMKPFRFYAYPDYVKESEVMLNIN